MFKINSIIIALFLILFSCNSTLKQDEKTNPNATRTTNTLHQVIDFPIIKDSSDFIKTLEKIGNFNTFKHGNISTYKKVKIYGSEEDYIFIEYNYVDESSSGFPYKCQFILTTKGKLIKIFGGLKIEFIEIFKNEKPFLMVLDVTSKGNGQHNFYKIIRDSLENVYDNKSIRTYDKHHDNKVYEPYELRLEIKDFNKDGFNDLCFYGKLIFIQGQTKYGDWFNSEIVNGETIEYSIDNPFKKTPIEFIFLYDKQSKHFKSINPSN